MGKKSKPTVTQNSQLGNDAITKDTVSGLRRGLTSGPVRASSQRRAGIGLVEGAGNDVRENSINAINDVASGKFLNADALGAEISAAADPAIRNFRRAIAPSIASEFAASGRTGSGSERAAFGDAADGLSRNIAEISQGALSGERSRQLQAAGFLPQIQGADIAKGQALTAQGAGLEALDPREQAFQRSLQVAGAIPGLRVGTTTTPGKKSGLGTAIGTGIGTVAGAYFGGPAGASLGASLGGSIGGAV